MKGLEEDKAAFVHRCLESKLQQVGEQLACYISGAIYSGPISLVMLDNLGLSVETASNDALVSLTQMENDGDPLGVIKGHLDKIGLSTDFDGIEEDDDLDDLWFNALNGST